MRMKRTIKKLSITSVAALALILFASIGVAPAQAQASDCKHVKGDVSVAFGPGSANGSVSNGGALNGALSTAFVPGGVMPTADPTSITFTADSTFTAVGGNLVTNDVYVLDFVLGVGSAMMKIDSAASTGIFAGASGVVYLNIRSTTPANGEAELAGTICYAN